MNCNQAGVGVQHLGSTENKEVGNNQADRRGHLRYQCEKRQLAAKLEGHPGKGITRRYRDQQRQHRGDRCNNDTVKDAVNDFKSSDVLIEAISARTRSSDACLTDSKALTSAAFKSI